jgi:hypothetical protein
VKDPKPDWNALNEGEIYHAFRALIHIQDCRHLIILLPPECGRTFTSRMWRTCLNLRNVENQLSGVEVDLRYKNVKNIDGAKTGELKFEN